MTRRSNLVRGMSAAALAVGINRKTVARWIEQGLYSHAKKMTPTIILYDVARLKALAETMGKKCD